MATKSLGRVSIVPQGDYDENQVYKRLDLVKYDGKTYLSLKEDNTSLLAEEDSWMLLTESGRFEDLTPQELEALLQPLNDVIESANQATDAANQAAENALLGIKDVATTATVPSPTGFERWLVHEEGTYTNFGGIVVSAADLDVVNGVANNRVILEVSEGVATKRIERVKGDVGPEADVSDLIIKAGEDVAALYKTDVSTAENSTLGILGNDGTIYGNADYFVSDFIKIEDDSLKYWTTLGAATCAVCVYDTDKVFIDGKTGLEMTNTGIDDPTERLLADDFDLSNAAYVRITCKVKDIFWVPYRIKVTYDKNIIINHTISVLDYNSDKPINSRALQGFVAQIEQLENIAKDVELMDGYVPYIELATSLMRGHFRDYGATGNNTITIISRVDDYTFTADSTSFSNNNPANVVIFDGEKYHPIRVLNVNTATNTFSTADKLPANCINLQPLFGDAIHLSRHGCKAMADVICDELKLKTSQRKNKIFGVYGNDSALSPYERSWIVGGQLKLVMEPLPGTVFGGVVGGILVGTFETQENTSQGLKSSRFGRYWRMNQEVQGSGCRFVLETAVKGYIRIVCGCNYVKDFYDGLVNIKATTDSGDVLYDKDVEKAGLLELIIPIDFDIQNVTFEISLLANEVTVFTIDQIEVFKTYLDDVTFLEGKKIMLMMDSWGGFPTPEGAEVPPLNPEGVPLQGMSFFAQRLRENLDSEVYNFSRGGTTSAYGRYWVEHFIENCPEKPDYCFVNYFINDSNSIEFTFPSGYDFSNGSPYEAIGERMNGITTAAQWLANTKAICDALLRHNITPIVIGHPMLGDLTPEFALRNTLFLKQF